MSRDGNRMSADSKREIDGGDRLAPLQSSFSRSPTKRAPSARKLSPVGSKHALTPNSGSGMRFTFEDGTPVGSMYLKNGPTMDEISRTGPTPREKLSRAAKLAASMSRGNSFMAASTRSLMSAGSRILRRKPKTKKQQIKTATQIMSEKRQYLKSAQLELEKKMSTKSWRSVREKQQQPQARPCMVLRPQSPIRLGWDLATLFLLLYIAVATPFQIGFSVDATGFWFYLEKVVDVFFITDLMLNFRTGFVAANGEEVLQPCTIARHYVTGWFWIDLLSSIPFDFIFAGLDDLRSAKMLKAGRVVKALRVVRLTKLVRFLKLAVFIEKLEEHFSINRNLLQLVKLLLGTVVMCHFFACMWMFFGTLDMNTDGWVYAEGVQDLPASTQYLTSFYWAVATLATVGYGDVVPVSDTERTFAIIGMLLGGGYFGYIIATMASLVSKLDASTAAYHNKMDAIVSYMKSRNLPRELQMRIRKYYKHYLEKKTAFDESRMLSELSTFLRQEVAMFLINDTLFKIPIFRDRDPTFVADLITVLKPLTCSEGDFIMREGEFGREMFVLIRGELEVLHDGHPLALLGPGSYFGEMSVLYQEHYTRQATIRAVTYCEMYSLSRDDLLFVCRDHQSVLDEMRKVAMDTYEELKRQRDLVARDDTNQIDASLLLHRGNDSSEEELDDDQLSRGQSLYDFTPSASARGNKVVPIGEAPVKYVVTSTNSAETDSKEHPALVGVQVEPTPKSPAAQSSPVATTPAAAAVADHTRSRRGTAFSSRSHRSRPGVDAAPSFMHVAYRMRRGLGRLETAVESLEALPVSTRASLHRARSRGPGLLLLPTAGAPSQRSRSERGGGVSTRERSHSVVSSQLNLGVPDAYSKLSVSAGEIDNDQVQPVGVSPSHRKSSRRRSSLHSPTPPSDVERLRASVMTEYEALKAHLKALGEVIEHL